MVLNNRDWNQVTWEQRAIESDPKFDASQDVPDFPYARYAELVGLHGIRVDRQEQIRDARDSALNVDRPVVLEAYTDPDVPPLPPHITFKRARAYASAILRGDSNSAGIIKASVKQIFAR